MKVNTAPTLIFSLRAVSDGSTSRFILLYQAFQFALPGVLKHFLGPFS